MALKDQLNDNHQGSQRTFTLSPEDIQVLAHLNKYMQATLDQVQEHIAATFLNHKATTEFGYRPGADLRFNFQPDKKEGNLTITEITEE